jgi:TPR repeat protein
MRPATDQNRALRLYSWLCLWIRFLLHPVLLLICCQLPVSLQASDISAQSAADTSDLVLLYQQAVTGDVQAQYYLFKIYRQGIGVERDIEKAKRWLISAATSGHAEAQYWLGYIYFTGQHTERDVEAAMVWYRKSADQGFVHAQVALAQIYNGRLYRFYPSDSVQATMWYTKAAEQGHIQSMFIVGCKHYFGLEQPIDVAGGLSWFQKAADAGDDTAMAYLKMDDTEDLRLFCNRVERL